MSNHVDEQYLKLLQDVMDNGVYSTNRTGINTKFVFGRQLRFDLSKGFPILTTKKVHFKSVLHELLWFLRGESNIKYLKDNNVTIWDEWADENGELGPVYGVQWRKWNGVIDQIQGVIHDIKYIPDSRRHIVSAWNVAEIPLMKLPPCHLLFQFSVHDHKLSCSFLMRSVDVFLGLPFNISSYAALTYIMAQVCDLEVGELVWTGNNVHIYENHFSQVKEQLARKPYELPMLKINPYAKDINYFSFDDFALVDYKCHPSIKAPIAV